MIRIAMILGLVAGLAANAVADGAIRVDVAVGEMIEQDVGFAMGLQCDDVAIVRVELREGTPESNTFAVTGVTEGTTMCRVGTAPNRPTYVFEIHVIAPRRRR